MTDLVISIVISMSGAALLAFGLSLIGREPVRWPAFAAALASLLFYWAVVVGGAELQAAIPATAHLHWNWIGKLVSTCAIVGAILLLPGISRDEVGLRFHHRKGSVAPALVCIVLLCALSWGVEAWFQDGRDTSFERLAYQALMPGLDEELFFRGLFLAFLLCAFDERWSLFGSPVGPAAVIATFIFAAGHGLAFAAGELHFNAPVFVLTGALGFGLLWIRQRTGSVLLAIIAHNLVNFGNSFF